MYDCLPMKKICNLLKVIIKEENKEGLRRGDRR